MAKAIGGAAMERRRKQANTGTSGVARKIAPAVQPKPHVPVAVVHGKRSLRRSAAAVINKWVWSAKMNQKVWNAILDK